MGEGGLSLGYIQNMDAILKVAILDQGQVFPKLAPLTQYLLGFSDTKICLFPDIKCPI